MDAKLTTVIPSDGFRTVIAVGACWLSIGSSALLAQETSTEAADTSIIVVGSRSHEQEVRQQAVEFIRQTGVAAGETPAARWVEPICPHAIGVAAAYAPMIEAKFRDVARQAGIPTAKTPCKTNIAIVFATDAAALVRRIAARDPTRFSQVPMSARADLRQGVAKVRWWYGSQLRGKDGVGANAMAAPWTTGNAEGGGSVLPMNSDTTSIQQYNSSIVSTQTIRALTSATVVIDVTRAEGVPLDAVVAYSALVGLAEIKAGASPRGSILTLFDGRSDIRDITERDVNFLKALYSMPLDREARQQRSRLVGELVAARKIGR